MLTIICSMFPTTFLNILANACWETLTPIASNMLVFKMLRKKRTILCLQNHDNFIFRPNINHSIFETDNKHMFQTC